MGERNTTPYEPESMPSSFDGDESFYEVSRASSLFRKLRAEPLVPLGALATCYALYRAQRAIKAGDRELTNRMFRARIFAQAFTLLAVVAGGMYYQKEHEKEKELSTLMRDRREKEKRERWIRELEMRDEEAKRLRSGGRVRNVPGEAFTGGSGTAPPPAVKDVTQASKPLAGGEGKLLDAIKEMEKSKKDK